ncbi:hypothetical protein AUJ14_02825 [Candidatus Micrarchaeota archaeon CG1_02_55_22]|nr:MAG: hypothetical protein AUJ14_02825 [Candidatus Micrarchaeota archaeon CG1_02_55_22]
MPIKEFEYVAGKPNPFLEHLRAYGEYNSQRPPSSGYTSRIVHALDRLDGGPTQRIAHIDDKSIRDAFRDANSPDSLRRALRLVYKTLEPVHRRNYRFSTHVLVGRYDRLNEFVVQDARRRSSDEPLTYCDVGCGMLANAPETLLTKRKLRARGVNVAVHGVDVVVPDDFGVLQRSAIDSGVKLFKSDYRTRRLPTKYDYIRLGNVAQYLFPEVLQRVFDNLAASLKPNGLLMVHQHGRKGLQVGVYRRVERDGKVFFRREQIPA